MYNPPGRQACPPSWRTGVLGGERGGEMGRKAAVEGMEEEAEMWRRGGMGKRWTYGIGGQVVGDHRSRGLGAYGRRKRAAQLSAALFAFVNLRSPPKR